MKDEKKGWVKLHRKVLDSRVFANEGLLKVWLYCLCRANHEHNIFPINTGRGNTDVEVFPGQFIFGRTSASESLGMNPSTVYKRMQKLEKLGNINMQSSTHYTLVTICHWDTYQGKDEEKEQAKGQPSNNQVTTKWQPSSNQVATKYQPSNTNKNDNNDKNVKNEKKEKKEESSLASQEFDWFEKDTNGEDLTIQARELHVYHRSMMEDVGMIHEFDRDDVRQQEIREFRMLLDKEGEQYTMENVKHVLHTVFKDPDCDKDNFKKRLFKNANKVREHYNDTINEIRLSESKTKTGISRARSAVDKQWDATLKSNKRAGGSN